MWKVGMTQFTPFNMAAMFQSGKTANIKNILHVPTITKNLVSVGKIVEQGMQVRFNHEIALLRRKADSLLVVKGKAKGLSSSRMR